MLVAASTAVWFIPYRAPLWLDETVSYWEISGGLGQIWSRTVAGLSFPAYFYILWITRQTLGNAEVMLRIPSVLAMIAAVYVLFRIAREFFDWETSALVCLLFCLHRDVAFAAIDVRPYAFAILATNLSIYALIVWLREPTTPRSLLLGASCALIFYFHYLYAVILPAFVLCYFIVRWRSFREDLRQIVVALAAFAVFFSPVVPRLLYVLSRRNTYSFAAPPAFRDLLRSFVPTVFLFSNVLLAAAVAFLLLALVFWLFRSSASGSRSYQPLLLAMSLALVPTVILFAASVSSPMRVFVERYRLVGVPGLVLLWGFFFSLVPAPQTRSLIALALVPFAVFFFWTSEDARLHSYTWKPALQYAQFIAEPDNAPLVVCSDLPQADFEPMPSGPASESVLFAPLSYYTVSVPVIPLPRALNEQAKILGAATLEQSTREQRRFLVLAYKPSYETLQWLIDQSRQTHATQILGGFDGIAVVEFRPLPSPN